MTKRNLVLVLILGLATFIASAYLSVTFYEERIAFGDAAFQLFSILRRHDLAIQVLRFGSCITQVFPLVGSTLHCDLKDITLLYSLSFELISIIALVLILFWLRNMEIALVLVLLKTLFTTHTFFWVQSELLQGLVFLLFYIAWLKNKHISRFSNLQLCVFFVFNFTLAFFHPLLIFPFLFCLLYYSFFEGDNYNQRTIHASILLFFFLTVIKSTVLKNGYDTTAMSGLSNFKTYFPHYLEMPINKQFLQLCATEYYFLPILLVCICAILIVGKKWLQLGYTILFTGAYFMLIQITTYEAVKAHFRLESFYIPIALMLAFIFVTEAFKNQAFRKTVVPFCFITLLCFVIRIEKTSAIYTRQLQWSRQFIAHHPNEKLVLNEYALPQDTMLLPWAFPYETWIISTIENNKTVSYAVSPDPHSFDWTLANNKAFLTAWGIFGHETLSTQYFIFQDDSIGYKHYSLP